MKVLAASLTFFNIATVSALLIGKLSGGLNEPIAIIALTLGIVAGFAAYLGTIDPEAGRVVSNVSRTDPPRRYTRIWLWIMAGCFAMFALRCFGWLLYIDSNEWKIQSPNNLGDLALHVTYIRNFANGVALWPDNPIYAFSHLRYPAGVDLFNGLLTLLHIDLARGLIWVGLLASIATFYAFYRWAGPFGVAGFLFNGGVVGFYFLKNFQFLDYQGDKAIAWKSIPLSMFVTQRGLLYAIPVGLLLLWHWRQKFFRTVPVAGVDLSRRSNTKADDPGKQTDGLQRSRLQPLPFWVELSLYASMPLFHVHTFLALTCVLVFLFAFESLQELKSIVDLVRKQGMTGMRSLISDSAKWGDLFCDTSMRKHILILVGSAVIPATFFVGLITDSFAAGSVVKWAPGWVMHDGDFQHSSFLAFWWMNFGLWLPIIAALIGTSAWRVWKNGIRHGDKLPEDLAFLLPAIAIFFLGLFIKFAPWSWDNLKIMIWGYFLVLPYLWSQTLAPLSRPARAGLCVALFGSGFVSLIGGLAFPGYPFAARSEVDWVGVAVQTLPVEARFAAFPVYNHPLLLQGRKLVLGYPGHLWTQGFDNYTVAEKTLRELMEGQGNWREAASQLRVNYIFWGREENLNYANSTRPWEKILKPAVSPGPWGAIYDLGVPVEGKMTKHE